MERRHRVSWIVRALTAVLVFGALPGTASAHEVAGSRFDAPLPLPWLFVGAGATVALTALWLTVTDRAGTPTNHRRHLLRIRPSVATPLRYTLRGLFLAGVLAALVLGFVGRQVAAENFATVFTWPVWFRGVAVLAVLVGSPWRTLSPWRTIYRLFVRLEGRNIALLGTYPAVLGSWPALAGFVVLIGLVGMTVVPRSPRSTTVILAVYALVTIGGALLYGPAWFRRTDPLEVFYRLFGRVAPIEFERTDGGGYDVGVRPPWQGCLDPARSVPIVVFIIATVYTVSFDGFTNTRPFQTALFGAREAVGTGPGTGMLLYALGLVGFVTAFGFASWLVESLGAVTAADWLPATRWFAPTVLPIAAAYEAAHNYPYVLRNLGQLLVVVGRPAFPGIAPVEPLGWLSLPVFWGSQVALIVLGHVIAVVAAHYVAVERYDSVTAARRGHLPLVALMVGYTVLSLWIISAPVVSG